MPIENKTLVQSVKMKVDARNYGKIIVLSISGQVVQADLISLAVEMPTACKSATHVIVLLEQVQFDETVGKLFVAWRDKRVPGAPRLVLAAANIEAADAKDLVHALDVIDTAEADRLIQVFARDHELTLLREKKETTDRQLGTLLGLPAKHTQAEFDAAALKLRDRHRNVKALLHVFGGARDRAGHCIEVETDAAERITNLENRALALVKKE